MLLCKALSIKKKSKDWLAWNQNSVSEWRNMSTHGLLQTSRKPSVPTDRNAAGPTISKYISDRMSSKTDIWKDRRLKFIPSLFPLPMALNSVFSFIKMSDRDLKFVYLFCQTDTFLFVIETPIQMYVNVNILLVGTSTCKTWNIKTEIYYWAQK